MGKTKVSSDRHSDVKDFTNTVKLRTHLIAAGMRMVISVFTSALSQGDKSGKSSLSAIAFFSIRLFLANQLIPLVATAQAYLTCRADTNGQARHV